MLCVGKGVTNKMAECDWRLVGAVQLSDEDPTQGRVRPYLIRSRDGAQVVNAGAA